MIRLVNAFKVVHNLRKPTIISSFSCLGVRHANTYHFGRQSKPIQKINDSPEIKKSGEDGQKKNSKNYLFSPFLKLTIRQSLSEKDLELLQIYFYLLLVVGTLGFSVQAYFSDESDKDKMHLTKLYGKFLRNLLNSSQTEGINTIVEEKRKDLKNKYAEWERQSESVKQLIKQVQTVLEINSDSLFQRNDSILFFQTPEKELFLQLLEYKLFNTENFKELLENKKIFITSIQEWSKGTKELNTIQELNTITQYIKCQPKKSATQKNVSMVLIIDNVQELSDYLENTQKNRQLFEVFHELKLLQQSGDVNVYGISYDSLFVSDLKKGLQDRSYNLITTQKRINQQKIKEIKQQIDKQSEILSDRIGKFFNILSNFEISTNLAHIAAGNLQTNENLEKKKTLEKQKQKRRSYIESRVFNGEQEACLKKIKLLITLLQNFNKQKGWKDEDLQFFSLSDDEENAYRELCKSKILFYKRFYKKEYVREFFDILKENKKLIMKLKEKGITFVEIIKTIGVAFYFQYSYQKSIEHLEKYIEIEGTNTVESAQLKVAIGVILKQMGKYPEAIEKFQEALKVFNNQKGKDNIDTAITLDNIGIVYTKQKNYAKAIQCLQKSLEIKHKLKGQRSIDTAQTLNSIGNVYEGQGNYPQSMKYYQKSLNIINKVKGQDSKGSVSVLNNMGNVYQKQGNYPKALECYQKCLNIQIKLKGQGSKSTAIFLNNMANVYTKQRNYPKALDCYKKCLDIQIKVKGQGSIDTASTLNNIGNVYSKQGNYLQAMNSYNKSLDINNKILGQGSQEAAITLVNIGNVYLEQEKYTQALKQYLKSLEITNKVLGKGSISSASTLVNIGNVYLEQGKYTQALKQYLKSLEITNKVLVKGSINSAYIHNNIGQVYFKQEKYYQALKQYQKSLKIINKVRGQGSIDAVQPLNNIGNVYKEQGKYTQALKQYQKSLNIMNKVLGQGSREAAQTLNNMGQVYQKQQNYQQSLSYYRLSLSIASEFTLSKITKSSSNGLYRCLIKLNREDEAKKMVKQYNLN